MSFSASTTKNYFSKNLHLVLILILGGVVFYNFIVSPHLNQISAAEQYKQAIEGLQNENVVLSKTTEMKHKKMATLQDEMLSKKESIFQADEAKEFRSSFELSAKEMGCALDSVNFMPVIEAGNLADGKKLLVYKAKLDVRGGFGNIARFIASLQKHPQKVWVNSVNIDNRDNSSNYLKGSMTVAIQVIENKEPVDNEKL